MPQGRKPGQGWGGNQVMTTEQRSASATKGWLNPDRKARDYERSLSDDQVRDVRRRLEAGETQVSIARDLGVAQPLISQIKTGKTYKSVV